MQQEKWWKEYERVTQSGVVVFSSNVPFLLQEHTERIIKEIEGMKKQRNVEEDDATCSYCGAFDPDCGCEAHNAALDAVINHLKK